MTVPLFSRRSTVARKPRRRIVDVRDSWRLVAGEWAREVVVRDYDGQLRRTWLPDVHPALVSYLERAAAVAA
jgi:hypothetical protein